ncbi:MAG: aminoglycoside phosphotransferase family protein [Pirellulaceae bacterium]|nr:aminoglycoside phosphotransferase family protein [Pirellulaceae bacterium]
MLSDENEALCGRDQAIAGLRFVLEPTEVLEVLQTGGLASAQAVRLDYLRYKPARRCIGLFNIDWCDSHKNLPTILVATAMTKDSWEKFRETRAAKAIEQGAILVPEKRLALEWFPNDHGLKNAAKVMSLSSRPKVLRRILQVEQPDAIELNTLAYKPARRHVASGVSQGKILFTLKTYTQRGYVDADWRIRLAMESGLSNGQVLGSSSHYSSIATSWIDGRTLAQWMLSPHCSMATLAKVGYALADWHSRGQQIVSRMPATGNQEADTTSLLELADDIGVLAPALAIRAKLLAQQLSAALSELPQANDLVHGDFYAKQVILDPSTEQVRFIDFDQLRLGDRYEDIANFVAKNYWQVIHEGLDEQKCAGANQQFLEGYASYFGPLDNFRLRLYVSIAILRCAPHAFRRALPDWTHHIERLLSLAEKWLNSNSPNHHHFPTPTARCLDAFLDLAQINTTWTNESSEIASPLNASTVTAAKLVRHKPQRRLLVEYTVQLPGAINSSLRVLGKARLSKGIDVRTPQLHRMLLSYDWKDSELRIPHVYGLLPCLSMWLQEYVAVEPIFPNRPLTDHIDVREAHARVGRAIADFHLAQVTIDRSYGVSEELKKLQELFADLSRARPELSDRLHDVEHHCQRLAASLPKSQMVPIHRDFYFDQVLVSGKHVYLLDLDLAAMGPAELDVGNYLAHLDEYAMRQPHSATSCHKLAEAFLSGYIARSSSVCMPAIATWRHLSLARHIALSARITGRSHTTLPLLDSMSCDARLAQASLDSHLVLH